MTLWDIVIGVVSSHHLCAASSVTLSDSEERIWAINGLDSYYFSESFAVRWYNKQRASRERERVWNSNGSYHPAIVETQRNLRSKAKSRKEDDGVSFYDGDNGCFFSPPPFLWAGVRLTYNRFVSISELTTSIAI